jgi:hypothetical protein
MNSCFLEALAVDVPNHRHETRRQDQSPNKPGLVFFLVQIVGLDFGNRCRRSIRVLLDNSFRHGSRSKLRSQRVKLNTTTPQEWGPCPTIRPGRTSNHPALRGSMRVIWEEKDPAVNLFRDSFDS